MTEKGKWDEFIPDVGVSERRFLEGGLELIAGLGIVDAYNRWCGKSTPEVGSRTESIMVSCPNPAHPDKIPSAWLNSNKDVFFCGSCQEGGDIMDIAAHKFGFPVPGYKKGRAFPELIQTCLIDMGYDPEEMMVAYDLEVAHDEVGTITPIDTVKDPDDGDVYVQNGLDWREFAPEGTFLWKWMKATEEDTIPEEFLFFLGLQMISMAVGRRVWISKGTPIYANVMLALMGKTGSGKSRAIRLTESLVAKALPFDKEDMATIGVKEVTRPNSGEALIDQFSWLPPGAAEPISVNGWVTMDEMAELMKAANRKGTTLREVIIQMYDGKGRLGITSRSAGEVVAVEPYFNFAVGAQPDAVGHIMDSGDVAAGFTNRFMFVQGTPKPRKPWAEISTLSLGSLHVDLQNIANTYASKPTPIMLDLDAEVVMDNDLRWVDEMMEKEGDIFGRLELHLIKLTMLLVANERHDIANPEHVKKARKLVEFLLPTTVAVDDETSVSYDDKIARRIIEIVQWYHPSKGKHPTDGLIKKQMNRTMRKQETTYMRMMEMLLRGGRLIEAPRTKEDVARGRTARRYMLPVDADGELSYTAPE